jgi:hypothetical protein
MKRGRKRKELPLEDAEGVLGELLPKAHPIEAEAQATRQCSGALLRTREPSVYAEVVRCLAVGFTVRNVMKMFGLGTHTVLAIARIEKLNVATLKGVLADAMLLGAGVFAERAIELAGECDSAFEAAGTAKSLAETSQLMRGQATQIIEEHVLVLDANKMAADMAADMAREAREMGFAGRENLALQADSTRISAPASSTDNKSAVSSTKQEEVTLLETLSEFAELPIKTGEGGMPS